MTADDEQKNKRGMVQYSWTIQGIVQHVFYRAFCKRHAEELGIIGYAKNLSDGRVLVVGQHVDAGVLAIFERFLSTGPPAATVEGLLRERTYEKLTNFSFTTL